MAINNGLRHLRIRAVPSPELRPFRSCGSFIIKSNLKAFNKRKSSYEAIKLNVLVVCLSEPLLIKTLKRGPARGSDYRSTTGRAGRLMPAHEITQTSLQGGRALHFNLAAPWNQLTLQRSARPWRMTWWQRHITMSKGNMRLKYLPFLPIYLSIPVKSTMKIWMLMFSDVCVRYVLECHVLMQKGAQKIQQMFFFFLSRNGESCQSCVSVGWHFPQHFLNLSIMQIASSLSQQ